MKKLILTTVTFTLMTQTALARTCKTQVKFNPGTTIKTSVYKCPDGTVSFSQPKSAYVTSSAAVILRAILGNPTVPTGRTESFCGATAAANVHNAYCKFYMNPRTIADKYFDDINPGVRYDTMLTGLNDFFANQGSDCVNGYWYLSHPKNNIHFLNALYQQLNSGRGYWKKSPAVVLINRTPENANMHWVTVVDIQGYDSKNPATRTNDSCIIHLNEWGDRTKVKCSDFTKQASQVNSPTITSWMHDYYLIMYR